jgi:hypothetical protein
MTIDILVKEIHDLIEKKTPKGISPFEVLREAVESFTPSGRTRIDEQKAKAILLTRGAVDWKKPKAEPSQEKKSPGS